MLHVHRAERADALVEALSAALVDPLPDPFTSEVIAVHTRGMERWLTQRLSACLGATTGRFDGVCANVEFPFPRKLVSETVAAATGVEPDEDRWLPARTVWPLLEIVDESLAEPWLRALSIYLGSSEPVLDPVRRGRRFGAVRHLVDLFDHYALHRPEMLGAWAAGRDTDGSARSLPDAVAWQAELWRRLRQRIGQPDPADRLQNACTRLRLEPEVVELPGRLSLFCLTRLPAAHLQVLEALAVGREVHLFLLHPSAALWANIETATGDRQHIVSRRDDPTAELPANRLLASWGQDAREMQLVLGTVAERVDLHHSIAERDDTLLARMQADVRADCAPPGPPLSGQTDARLLLDAEDRSLQIHACHGRARQVEVLRDSILHLLEEDATLEPRDVIVMCPDIEAFAPLIHATFGAGDALDDHELDPLPTEVRPADLRVRLADRSLRQTNPVLGVVAQLIELPEQRLTVSQLLDFADQEPVRRRFRLDDDDLGHIRDWAMASGVRWGLDAIHRAPFKLEALAAGTWRAGIDRLLLGVTMTEDEQRLFAEVLPLDDVDSGAIDLAGRLAELLDRLQASLDTLSEVKTIDRWATALATAADALTATSERDAWQRAELVRLLDQIVNEATIASATDAVEIALPELRALLADRLGGRPTRANFRTGHLSICTLFPMRSVPHRVVCLLGLDDGHFPRKAPRDGDDLLLEDPHVGDRDPRSEDCQMLLDALLAASERLIITYTGNDERTNMPVAPAVPVGELLDVVDRTARGATSPAREHVVVRHPLQPFDPRNFTPGALASETAWSFDRVALEGARALSGERREIDPFLAGPLPDVAGGVVELENLVRFVERPVRAFLRQRLGIAASDISEEVEDALPVELDNLGVWQIGQRLLDGHLAGTGIEACIAAEIARGTLPPGELASGVIDRVRPTVEAIAAHAGPLLGGAAPGSVDVRVSLAGERSLTGTVPNVSGDVVGTTTYSRVNPRHRLAGWVRLLALSAAHPERPFEAVTVGRAASGSGADVTIARFPALAADAPPRQKVAQEHLQTLLDIYDRGMREPLPLPCLAAAAYAQAVARGANAEAAARKAWASTYKYDKEDREAEHVRVLGGTLSLEELLALPPHADEQGDGWEASEASRFGRYARRLWSGLLAHEVVTEA
jgi:exodeoxyribonuclease V gamma subunit